MNQPCPHCSRPIAGHNMQRHAEHCPKNPDMMSRMREFMEDANCPGHARKRATYYQGYSALNLPYPQAVMVTYGTWDAFLAALGLQPPIVPLRHWRTSKLPPGDGRREPYAELPREDVPQLCTYVPLQSVRVVRIEGDAVHVRYEEVTKLR